MKVSASTSEGSVDYLHLSRTDGGTGLVQTTDPRIEAPGHPPYFWPRFPDHPAEGEPDTPRFCMAPTLWQCLFSRGEKKEDPADVVLHIYRLSFDVAIPIKPGIPDQDKFDERYLLDAEIGAHGGHIPMAHLGMLRALDFAPPTHMQIQNTGLKCLTTTVLVTQQQWQNKGHGKETFTHEWEVTHLWKAGAVWGLREEPERQPPA